MKIAVLFKGMPRFIEEGSDWINKNVFTDEFRKDCVVDYFCYFWNDNSQNLKERVEKCYSPKKYNIVNYDMHINSFKNRVFEWNEKNKCIEQYLRRSVIEFTNEPYFWGQYLSVFSGIDMIDNIDYYDVILIIRSDTMILINDTEDETKESILFRRLAVGKNLNGIVPCSSSVDIETGHVHIGDLFFITSPAYIKKYCKNGYDIFFDILTKDKLLFYRYNINPSSPSFYHELWRTIGDYNRCANFENIRFYERFSKEIDSILIRDKEVYWNGDLEEIKQIYIYSMKTYDTNYEIWYQKYKNNLISKTVL